MIRLSGAIQEALLAVLAFDLEGGTAVRAALGAEDFDAIYNDFYRLIAEYRDEFKNPPGEHLLDLAEALVKARPKEKQAVRELFQSILSTKGDINRDYVLKQARVFARYQGLRRAIDGALDNLEKGDETGLVMAEGGLADAIKKAGERASEDTGTFLHDPVRALRFLEERQQPFPMGIPELDQRGLGLARKRLLCFMAPPKAGKSWFLVHLAKECHRQGLRVLYVTLELSEAEVAGRFLQSFYSFQKRKADLFRARLVRDEATGRVVDVRQKKMRARPTFQDSDVRRQLEERIESLRHRPRLMIQEFPTQSLTLTELEATLDSLEHQHRFIPDVLLIDYPDLMTTRTRYDQPRHALREIFQGLRGIGVRRDLAVGTVTQANRAARSARLVTDEHIAEDYSKVATADLLLTYSQTIQERALGLARLFVAAGRTDEDKFAVLLTQNYGIGQFALDSAMMPVNYWSLVEEQDSEE